jgi:hypothetical protein
MRDLVFPSTSNKSSKHQYLNGKSHLQNSLTEDSYDEDLPSDDESIHELYKNEERLQDVIPGNVM